MSRLSNSALGTKGIQLKLKPNDEVYTQPWIIQRARAVMGGIDLDPASCKAANEHSVKAAKFYTAEDDGLSLPWAGRMWCNPPFSKKREFVDKLMSSNDLTSWTFLLPFDISSTPSRTMMNTAKCCIVLTTQGDPKPFWNADGRNKGGFHRTAIFFGGEFVVHPESLPWPERAMTVTAKYL